jgi:integrase
MHSNEDQKENKMGEPQHEKTETYYQAIIDEAERVIDGVALNIQLATLTQYTKVAERLTLAGQKPIDAAKTKGSYYAYRAAWIGYHAHHMRVTLSNMASFKQHDVKRWQQEAEGLQYFIDQLKACPPDPLRQQRHLAMAYDDAQRAGTTPPLQYTNAWRGKTKQKTSKKTVRSKKQRTRQLPVGWQDTLFQAALDKPSRHILALAVLMCCGCRPKELENGIDMTLNFETGAIHFVISCAKRKNETTEFRQFTLKNKSRAFIYLVSQLWFYQGELRLRGINYKAVSTEVGRLSLSALRLKEQVSPYCFRHAFSGDLHAAGLNSIEIAQCLGHNTDKTQAYYSHSQKHRTGGFKIEAIASTEAVRPLTTSRLDTLKAKLADRQIDHRALS